MSAETNEISKLMEEIQQLKSQLAAEKQKNELLQMQLNSANVEVADSHKKMTDSINYARCIQNAIMPPMSHVKKLLPDSFILYLPKDIVSGDFYFVEGDSNQVIFSVVDCTGHGVPGALMSVVGFNCLHQAVVEKKLRKPSEILNFLDIGVNLTLRQTGNESGVKDGMDLALCNLDMHTHVLQYAGAFNQMYYIKGDELIEIKADKFPIGVNHDGVADEFTNHVVQMEKGDLIYLFSDGYADQFGGPNRKKFKYNQLRELLLKGRNLSMEGQRELLEKTILDWKGNIDQIDDILIMGVRV